MTRFPLAVGFATVLLAGLLTPTAVADDKVVLGGGAGIVVGGTYCTLATIGHDKTGELAGFTAGHCGGPGAPVVAEGADDHGTVGTVAAVGDGLDYAVIKFDPAKAFPTANIAGFAINGLGPNPGFQQPSCTQGAATGNYCSRIISLDGPGPHAAMAAPWQPGDAGSPVTIDSLLVGLIYDGVFLPPGRFSGAGSDVNFVKFSAVLNDVNAKGGPGAGFSPV